MSVEETLRSLEEWKKQKGKAYIELKGMLKGIRLGELSPTMKAFIRLLEVMTKGFNDISDNLVLGFELQITTIKKVKSLETKIEELETNILQLSETLDKLYQAR